MSEETIENLRKLTERMDKLDYKRDLLILRAALDKDSMTDLARACHISRTQIYRVRDEVKDLYDGYMDKMTDAEFWEAAAKATGWKNLRENN